MPQLHNPKGLPIAVIDINVFVSGTTITNPESFPKQTIDSWKNEDFQLATSEPILQKLSLVYRYPKVRKITGFTDNSEIDNFIDDIRKNSTIVPGTTPINISPDPEDNNLFSCAIEAKAKYIVSGDRKHVLPIISYQGIKILTPKDFVEEILIIKLTTT